MKLKDLQNQYNIVQKIYDNGITDFQEKWNKRPAFQQLKKDVDYIEEERQRLLKEYANEQGQIPQSLQQTVDAEFRKVLETDVSKNEKNYPKFGEEEIKKASESGKLTSTEIATLDDAFIRK
ncbi:MAG: hypothetical protein KGY70_19095 [Bacteroidales bacterium]|nr:hypothetical protein [Bacteroidales bacterium]